ncbi:MAG: hypothetical protein M3Y87_35780, partial [Myxococcota bacterium]|nr:hypothetical protein [Myxococcota bacterium]
MIALAQLVALGAGLVALAALVAVHVARRGVRPAIDRLPPSAQVIVLEAALALPWVLPAVALTLALAPSFAALVWPAIDHCGAHGDHHAHLCALHPPHHVALAPWLLVALGALWITMRLGR